MTCVRAIVEGHPACCGGLAFALAAAVCGCGPASTNPGPVAAAPSPPATVIHEGAPARKQLVARWMPGPVALVEDDAYWLDFGSGFARRLASRDGPLICAHVGPRGRLAFTVSASGTASLWDVESARVLRSEPGWATAVGVADTVDPGGCTEAFFCPAPHWSPDGAAVVPNHPARVELWNASGGHSPLASLGFRFSPDGASIFDGATALLPVAGGPAILSLEPAASVVFDRRGRKLALNTEDHRAAALIDVETAGQAWRRDGVVIWAMSPEGKYVVGEDRHAVHVLDAATGSTLATWPRAMTTCGSGHEWRGGEALLHLDDDRLWMWTRGRAPVELAATLEGETCGDDSLRASPDGSRYATHRRIFAADGTEIARLPSSSATELVGSSLVGWSREGSHVLIVSTTEDGGTVAHVLDGSVQTRHDAGCGVEWVGASTLAIRKGSTLGLVDARRGTASSLGWSLDENGTICLEAHGTLVCSAGERLQLPHDLVVP